MSGAQRFDSDDGTVTLFVCTRGSRPVVPPCSRCARDSSTTCASCEALLCGEHARHIGAEVRCATHAANQVSASMPRPPGRAR